MTTSHMRWVLPLLIACAVTSAACGSGVPVSPLAAATRAGDVAEIDRLLASGADINAGSGVNDWPPIVHAIHKQQLVALAHLLDRGAAMDGLVMARALNVARGSGDEAEVRPILDAHRPRTTVSATP